MSPRTLLALVLAVTGCAVDAMPGGPQSEAIDAGPTNPGADASSPGALPDAAPEAQPPPLDTPGNSDPLSRSLHNRLCAGIDWQRVHGWLLLPHKAPEIGPADEMARCFDRYAGWVTREADAAGVSRASVYAALATTGQCEATTDYDGAILSGALCTAVHPDLAEADCLAEMARSRAFGIATLAAALGADDARKAHRRDVPLMAAYLGHGSVACGG
ncbi:MAG TPA: hypothetical protein VFG83_19695, partial [Kofleriaceae bacterium]|nr:hypothetical protein [Kofleriaceae bacterium]